MDLRGKLSPAQLDRARTVLDYQPFILSDDLQTGAAYSWMYGVNITSETPTLFRRNDYSAEEWQRISDANGRCRRMYDSFVGEIADRYKGGTLLDFACNNGYFPVKAELCGMHGVGADAGAYFGHAVGLLNEVLGTGAEFLYAPYDFNNKTAPIGRKCTVVSASAIMCHQPDPLNFLAFLGSHAEKALFIFDQVLDTDYLLVSYQKPHPDLALPIELAFPFRFNHVTRLSRGLLYHACEDMGFTNIVELPWSDDYLPPYFCINRQAVDFAGDEVRALEYDLRQGSKAVAVLAMRP